jgi:hypothetical protein
MSLGALSSIRAVCTLHPVICPSSFVLASLGILGSEDVSVPCGVSVSCGVAVLFTSVIACGPFGVSTPTVSFSGWCGVKVCCGVPLEVLFDAVF